jgi:hypothetical protein
VTGKACVASLRWCSGRSMGTAGMLPAVEESVALIHRFGWLVGETAAAGGRSVSRRGPISFSPESVPPPAAGRAGSATS